MTDRFTLVIFGATGDLSIRKLFPSLYNLFHKKQLPTRTRILGASTSKLSDEEFRKKVEAGIHEYSRSFFDPATWEDFARTIHYQPTDVQNPDDYQRISKRLQEMEEGPTDRLFHLALAPRFFQKVVQELGRVGLTQEAQAKRRVIVEKPFGHDTHSATELNHALHETLREEQIYRIDHYLGKESVQNLMVLRFGNAIFEPLWNRNYIDHVQITVAEMEGIGKRARYYDQTGSLRDMVQSHLLQVLTLVAMEPPAQFEPEALRNEKVKVLSALRPILHDDVNKHTIRAQYRGYLSEEGVDPQSLTNTFTALRVFIDNWRWQDVPFFFRTGKALQSKVSEINIVFRCPPHQLFGVPGANCKLSSNTLSICLQPDEGFHLQFETKVPGSKMVTQSNDMEFYYDSSFDRKSIPDAYERLLLDAVLGDASLFTRSDEIVKSWQFVDRIVDAWGATSDMPMYAYESGSWGPKEADRLLHEQGARWIVKCVPHGSRRL